MEDVKILFFGLSKRLIVQDEHVSNEVKDTAVKEESFACKATSDREGPPEEIKKLNVKVEYVESIISNFIKDGYLPMVWQTSRPVKE